jgi:integrase/recombinase XerD
MKIEIVPVVKARPVRETPPLNDGASSDFVNITNKSTKLQQSFEPKATVVDLDKVFAEFLQLEVGDGAASADTIRSYLSQTKQYLDWC